MRKFALLFLVTIISAFNLFCEEFTINYNEGTDQPYKLVFHILDDVTGTVEISESILFEDAKYTVDVIELPSFVSYNNQEYIVTTLNCGIGSLDAGPKKIIIPSTVRWIKRGFSSPFLEEIIFDNAPIEELYYIQPFSNNENLKYVDFGNSCILTKLPWGCFEKCPSLTYINLPESLKSIEPYAFDNCISLQSITLPSSLESIERAFMGCISLEEVIYNGKNLIDVGCDTFKNCESLKSISLPSVSYIGNGAFLNCKSLSSVTLNESRNGDIRIDSHAFDNCIKLNELKFDVASLKEIGEAAFQNCSSLQSFSIPSDCENIGSKAFVGCIALEEFNVIGDGGSYSDIDGVLIRDGYQIVAYPNGKGDVQFSIPETITSIASGAFEGAVNLADISFHNNVTDLGVMAFRDCKALKKVDMPESLNHIPSGTFSGCSSLESVNIPDNYIYIGTSSFQDCSELPEVKLPSELKVLGEGAFINCTKIENIELPDNMTEIRTNTFRNCEALKSISLPAHLDTIHSAALQGCKSLKSIKLSESLKSLEERAFKGCESLGNLTIPDGVTQVGTNAFEDCSSLKEVVVGNGVKEIGQWAFYNCTDMEKLVLGNSLESIGAQAFDGDINIKNITCLSPEPPSFPGGFPTEVVENATVTVPEGSEDAYNASPEWDPMVEGEVQKAESIELNYTKIDLEPKETVTLVAVVLPEDAVDRSVTWSSSDYFVAKVDETGLVKAGDYGSAVITATASNGVTATCRVTVKDKPIMVSSITLDHTNIEAAVGETIKIRATVLPEDATDKTLSWDSSDEGIATVDKNGVVKITGIGTAVITASTTDGSDLHAECIVNGVSSVDSIIMEQGHIDIYNLEGILIKKDADLEFWNTLPKGIYIIHIKNNVYKITK